MIQTIHLATDHAGFEYKELIKKYLEEKGYSVVDHGAYVEDATDDYPLYIHKAAIEVSQAREDYEQNPKIVAIILGGSGQGEAIAAGRLPYVRTATCYSSPYIQEIVRLSRQHNNANVLSIGARFMQQADVLEVVNIWINTSFSKDTRHIRRLQQIENQ
jgi:ribose 5-phosphate isomerase B